MGIKEDTVAVSKLIDTTPELSEQFTEFAKASLLAVQWFSAEDNGHISALKAVESAMIIGATLYKDFILGKGTIIKEVKDKTS